MKNIITVCAVLQSFDDVNGQRGRDVAAEIYGMHLKGQVKRLRVAIENLPDDVQKAIENVEQLEPACAA